MELTLPMVLIASVGVFLGSFVDAVAGGGGLIILPAYLLAGLPAHVASATNKLTYCFGVLFSGGRFIKSGFVNWRVAIPGGLVAIGAAALGVHLQLLIPEVYFQYLLVFSLPVVALVVLKKKDLEPRAGEITPCRQFLIVVLSSLVVGVYDGFYGPGAGMFLLLLYTQWARLDLRTANGSIKVINFASSVSGLVTFLLAGKVFWTLGLILCVFAALGHYVGSGCVIKDGQKVVRPVIVLVLCLLVIRIMWGLF